MHFPQSVSISLSVKLLKMVIISLESWKLVSLALIFVGSSIGLVMVGAKLHSKGYHREIKN